MAGALLIPLTAMADGTITGKVLNGADSTPLEYATVQLIDAKTKKPLLISSMTDADGSFSIKAPDGRYLVRITNAGNVMQERSATVAGADITIGSVSLAPDSKLLKEVVVEGIRSQMRFELDRKVFQVDANISATGLSASELLEAIPSVEVDQDGEVSLRGNSSVTVWINGKESGLTADNRAQILEQIPAETIERVEVITNPSAKYSPEGTAGIINIVLKENRKAGHYGSAELGANTRGGANASFNFNYSSGKWDAFAGVGLRMRHNKNTSGSERIYDNSDFLNSEGESNRHGNNVFLRLGGSYRFTQKDELSLSGFGMFGHNWGNSLSNYTSNVPGQWIQNLSRSSNKGDMRGAHAELSYTHKFSKTHTLDMLIGYNFWGGPPRWNYYEREQHWPGDTPDTYVYEEQTSRMGNNGVEVKVDYSNQFTSWLKFEAGFNGNYTYESSPTTTWQGESTLSMTDAQASKQLIKDLYNRFIYDNNISAFYVTLGGKVKSFSYSAGLRAETWQVHTKSLTYEQELAGKDKVDWYKKSNFALFPSLFLSYALPKDNEVQINYTRRIRRPWGGQLNSFRDISNPTNISYGNPELAPQYSNAFEINYLKSWDMHIISFSAYLRTADDCINRISYIVDGVMYSTNANVSSTRNIGVEIVSKNSFFRNKFDLTTTINLHSNHMDAWDLKFNHLNMETGTTQIVDVWGKAQNNFAWSIRMMAGVRLPWGISAQATGRYSSKHVTAQGSRNGGWSVDLGIRKNLGNWSFSINCRDLFDSRKFKSVINGETYTQRSWSRGAGRTVQFTIKYSFGNMKGDRKKNRNQGEPMDGSGYGNSEMMEE